MNICILLWWFKYQSLNYKHFLYQLIIPLSQLGVIDKAALRGLPALESLVISQCNMTAAPSLYYVRRYLFSVNINDNKIPHIPDKFFQQLKQLPFISLRGNRLTEIPNLIGVSSTITMIDLGINKIVNIDNIYQKIFPRLQSVSLDHNHIGSFRFKQTSNWPSLNFLNLAKNNISILRTSQHYLLTCSHLP